MKVTAIRDYWRNQAITPLGSMTNSVSESGWQFLRTLARGQLTVDSDLPDFVCSQCSLQPRPGTPTIHTSPIGALILKTSEEGT